MRFRLAPRSMTLDDIELDGGRPPLFSDTQTRITPAVYNVDMMFGSIVWGFPAEHRFPLRGLHTCIAVARNYCVS